MKLRNRKKPRVVEAETASEQAQVPHVLLATPAYGGMVTATYLQSVIPALSSPEFQLSVYTLMNESLITRARNTMVATFMANTQYDELLFVDADIGFDVTHITRLLGREGVRGSVTPLKTIQWDRVAQAKPNTGLEAVTAALVAGVNNPGAVEEDGFAPVRDLGSSFMAISRSAMQKIWDACPELAYTPDDDPNLECRAVFDTFVEDGRFLSEDYAFCRRWQSLGEQVYVDMQGPLLRHVGGYVYGSVG